MNGNFLKTRRALPFPIHWVLKHDAQSSECVHIFHTVCSWASMSCESSGFWYTTLCLSLLHWRDEGAIITQWFLWACSNDKMKMNCLTLPLTAQCKKQLRSNTQTHVNPVHACYLPVGSLCGHSVKVANHTKMRVTVGWHPDFVRIAFQLTCPRNGRKRRHDVLVLARSHLHIHISYGHVFRTSQFFYPKLSRNNFGWLGERICELNQARFVPQCSRT